MKDGRPQPDEHELEYRRLVAVLARNLVKPKSSRDAFAEVLARSGTPLQFSEMYHNLLRRRDIPARDRRRLLKILRVVMEREVDGEDTGGVAVSKALRRTRRVARTDVVLRHFGLPGKT